jgi:ketosteroid isomerase-like protein
VIIGVIGVAVHMSDVAVRVHDGRMAAADMTRLVNTFYSSIASGDSSAFAELLAPDVLVIGTDDAEWWQGKNDAISVIQAQVSEMHDAGMQLIGGDPQVVEASDAVWVADRPTLELEDGTSVPLRLTAIATREGNALLIRQMHLSSGAPNEEIVQQELTL